MRCTVRMLRTMALGSRIAIADKKGQNGRVLDSSSNNQLPLSIILLFLPEIRLGQSLQVRNLTNSCLPHRVGALS